MFKPSTFWEHNQRGIDYGAFITTLETDLTRWYIDRIRSMGYRGLVTHCDWLQHFRNAVPRNEVDVISMHGYHAHPGDFDNRRLHHFTGEQLSRTNSTGGAASPAPGSWIGRSPSPSTAMFTGTDTAMKKVSRVGGYSAFQDHDLIMAHASPVRAQATPGIIRPFGVGNDPVARASQVVSGLDFHAS